MTLKGGKVQESGQRVEAPGERTDPPGPAAGGEVGAPPGVPVIRVRVEVPEDTGVQIDFEARTRGGQLVERRRFALGQALARSHFSGAAARGESWLFWAALGLYALTRLVALPSFPIYFFTDEAVQTVTAADLLRDHFFSPTHEFLPTYFDNGSQYNLSASVYLQLAPYFLFGKSIWVTRGTAALTTLIAAASVGLICRRVYHSPFPWLAVLFLSITPAWFLHSRTAFETALAASLYAGFLYCYLSYRVGKPRFLYGAVAFGALAFYAYNPMRMVMLLHGLLLLALDWPFHRRQGQALLRALGLGLLLALPFLRFALAHPDAGAWQMHLLGSYWVADLSLWQKLRSLGLEYLRGLDPLYWYLPHTQDLPRHLLLGYGHVHRLTFPFALLGLALVVRRLRQPEYRTLGIALAAAPSGAALVQLGITRALVMVIPLAILTALGAGAALNWLQRRWRWPRAPLALAAFALLAGANLWMLRDALVNGPRWYPEYGLTGMQYGARQVFGAVADYLRAHPGTRLVLSPSWSNGTDRVARFFFDDPLPFELGSPDDFFNQVRPLENTVLVMLPEEFSRIPATRFAEVKVEQTLPYPDGRPGFYFVRLKYVDHIQAVIAREEAERRQPERKQLWLDGQPVQVTYTRLDIGQIEDALAGGAGSLVRTDALNPMRLDFAFPTPRPIDRLTLRVGGTATRIVVRLWAPGADQPALFTRSLPAAPDPREVQIGCPGVAQAARVQVEIHNTDDPPEGHVHLWRLAFH